MITDKENNIYFNSSIDIGLQSIAKKVLQNNRISVGEGIYLFEKGELGFLGSLANSIRTKKHGDFTYFNRNIFRC